MKETPTQLRYALRLIHSLQKERGASASHYAYTISHPVVLSDDSNDNNTSHGNHDGNAPAPAPALTGIGASLHAADAANANANANANAKSNSKNTNNTNTKDGPNCNSKRNSNLPTDVYFSKALLQARQGTDVAFHMIVKYENETMGGVAPGRKCTVWADALQRVRNKIDQCCLIFTGKTELSYSNYHLSNGHGTNGSGNGNENGNNCSTTNAAEDYMANSQHGNIIGPHRVIVMFNMLIGNVMDEIVLQLINKEINFMKQKIRHDSGLHHGTSVGVNDPYFYNYKSDKRNSLPANNAAVGIGGVGIGIGSEHEQSTSLERQSRHHSQQELNALDDSSDGYDKPCKPNFFARSLPIDAVDVTMDNSCSGVLGGVGDHQNFIGEAPPKISAAYANGGRLMNTGRLNGHGHGGPLLDHCISSSLQLSSPEMNEYEIPIAASVPVVTLEDAARKLKQSASASSPNEKSYTSMSTSITLKTHESSPNIHQLLDLLSVLLSFTQLKESTGVERSIVCSLMALSSDEEESYRTKHSTSKLFNDLVVEEANQRMIVRDLQQQSKVLQPSSLSLLKMIEKFVRPGREMESVQDKIKDFDLEGVQNSMKLKDFWKVITAYIDQLHALELLIVEEVQFEMSREMMLILRGENSEEDGTNKAGASVKTNPISDFSETPMSAEGKMESNAMKGGNAILDILCSDADLSTSEAIKELSRLPAEQIKQRLLSFMQGGKDGDTLESSTQVQNSIDVEEEVKNPLMKMEPSHNLKEWEIDLYEIEFRQRIGRGVAGTTYLAKWSGQQVAVKVAAITDLGLEGWYTEVHSLKRLHHPNVIRLLGSIYNPSPQTYGLVLEYCNSGDLSKALHRPTPSNFFWKIADDVANGMSYLHRKMIMHRDIKPANILLDGDVQGGNFNAKLTDFGVAVMHSGLEEHTAETGTYRWMAPEVIRHESYSFMADVYSYALVVWQLVTRENPFKSLSQIEAAGKVAIDDARPPFPPNTPQLVMALIERCWSQWPDDRLSFAQITIELKEIHRVLSEKDKTWLREPEGHPVYEVKEKKMATPVRGKGPKDGVGGRRSRGSSPRVKRRGSGSSHRSQNGSGLFSFFTKRRDDIF